MKNPHKYPHEELDALLEGVAPAEANRLRAVWDLVGEVAPSDLPAPTEAALQRFLATLPSETSPPRRTPSRTPAADRRPRLPRARRRGRLLPAGIVAFVVVLAGFGLFWWLGPVVERALPGQVYTVVLPDGSQVELNSGATLRYRRSFGAERVVTLNGEAFFDVQEDRRPFVVHTFNAQVRVLGTRFNVRAWPGTLEPGTTVALESGRVLLASADGEETRTLHPGETMRVGTTSGAGIMDQVAVSVREATAWRRGDFIFKDQALGAILADVERRFEVVLAVEPSALLQQRLNLVLRRPDNAETVLRDLSAALGLQYRETSNGYVLFLP